MIKLQNFAPVILRVGIAFVFLWFGTSQLSNPESWLAYLPGYVENLPISTLNLVFLNGLFEVLCGGFLLLGLYTRLVAFLLALHLAHIITIVGFTEIGVRDFGLFMATLSLSLSSARFWSLDNKFSLSVSVSPQA